MNPTYAQGADMAMTLTFENFSLQAGDTVSGEFRRALTDAVPLAQIGVDGVTATVDTAAQNLIVRIPAAVSAPWQHTTLNFTVYTTLYITTSDGTRRLPVEVDMPWRASYTRSLA